jgi:hypothetical protein
MSITAVNPFKAQRETHHQGLTIPPVSMLVSFARIRNLRNKVHLVNYHPHEPYPRPSKLVLDNEIPAMISLSLLQKAAT